MPVCWRRRRCVVLLERKLTSINWRYSSRRRSLLGVGSTRSLLHGHWRHRYRAVRRAAFPVARLYPILAIGHGQAGKRSTTAIDERCYRARLSGNTQGFTPIQVDVQTSVTSKVLLDDVFRSLSESCMRSVSVVAALALCFDDLWAGRFGPKSFLDVRDGANVLQWESDQR